MENTALAEQKTKLTYIFIQTYLAIFVSINVL